MRNKDCNIYEGGVIPPCSALLSNENPIIKDGRFIYRNENRLFYFISAAPTGNATGSPSIVSNLQISMNTFIIGLYINQVQRKEAAYDEGCSIHQDKALNSFIHEVLRSGRDISFGFNPTLSFVISNGNAILVPYTYTLRITALNYLILFVLNRLEGNPGLYFINNSFAEENDINLALAQLNIQYPIPSKTGTVSPARPPAPGKARKRFI